MLSLFKKETLPDLDGAAIRAYLRRRAADHCQREGIPPSTLSRRALNNGKFFDNLDRGRDFTVGSFDRLIRYMDEREGKSR